MGNLSLQRGPWNFWNSQTSPSDPVCLLPPLAPLLRLCSAPAAAAHRRHSFPSATSCCIPLPRVALYLSHLGSSFPLASSALATRTPSPCGRHRAAAVASSKPSAQLLCCERISTTGSSSTYSNHPIASSSPLATGTP
jgi:hypothetical protein